MTSITANDAAPPVRREVIYRHGVIVRITHWINVVVISLLIMSGLNILSAHPRLYWGQFGADADHPWFEVASLNHAAAPPSGALRIGGYQIDTTGLLGVSKGPGGQALEQAFPNWATLPAHRDLATARRWHFFLAWVFVINGTIYLLIGLLNRHLWRDLAPRRAELAPRNVWRSIVDHIRLKHPVGEEARRYNILQKFAYLAVIVVLLPAMVLTGLTMSPGGDAIFPWLTVLFGGRQSARAIHFITANLIVLFVIVHIVEVFLAGVWNELRSMITGRYAIRTEAH
ncbi:MAG TPA: cytochrome b/b6 domain-containing protein [Caulobacteraceae bacterium]|jgi:thiosulfate reductase cytochrome b subunit|nr:cytochrome b/b6 domain-containing protein [Caulobacteraceae bacterium]